MPCPLLVIEKLSLTLVLLGNRACFGCLLLAVALTLLRLAFLTEVVAAALLHCRGVSRGWGAAVLGSDSGGEFGEDLRDPVPRIDVGAKFVVAAVEVLNEGVSCADHSRGAQSFETAHRP
jgi:hypothetical protein